MADREARSTDTFEHIARTLQERPPNHTSLPANILREHTAGRHFARSAAWTDIEFFKQIACARTCHCATVAALPQFDSPYNFARVDCLALLNFRARVFSCAAQCPHYRRPQRPMKFVRVGVRQPLNRVVNSCRRYPKHFRRPPWYQSAL